MSHVLPVNTGPPQKPMVGGTHAEESNGDTPDASLTVTPTKGSSPTGPFGNATIKEPSGDVASSLGVVCYPCLCELSVWNYIRPSHSCKEPCHDKVHFFIWGDIYDNCVIQQSGHCVYRIFLYIAQHNMAWCGIIICMTQKYIIHTVCATPPVITFALTSHSFD